MQAPYGGRAGGAAAGGRCWGQGERGAGFETDHIIPFCLRCCALRASTWLTADLYRGSVLYIYIYIYIVCNYSQPVAAAVATDIYIYTRIHIIYIHIYQYQSGLCCSTSPACTLLGYVHGSSAVFCLASVGHAGVADRLHLEVVKQPAKYVTVLKAFPDPWGRQDFKNTHLLKRGRSPGPAQ